MNKMHRPSIDGVVKRNTSSAARSIRQLIYVRRPRQRLGSDAQILLGLDDEGGAAELGLVGLDGAEDPRLRAVAAEVYLLNPALAVFRDDSLLLGEAEVEKEIPGFLQVRVLVVYMCYAQELDFSGKGCHIDTSM